MFFTNKGEKMASLAVKKKKKLTVVRLPFFFGGICHFTASPCANVPPKQVPPALLFPGHHLLQPPKTRLWLAGEKMEHFPLSCRIIQVVVEKHPAVINLVKPKWLFSGCGLLKGNVFCCLVCRTCEDAQLISRLKRFSATKNISASLFCARPHRLSCSFLQSRPDEERVWRLGADLTAENIG